MNLYHEGLSEKDAHLQCNLQSPSSFSSREIKNLKKSERYCQPTTVGDTKYYLRPRYEMKSMRACWIPLLLHIRKLLLLYLMSLQDFF